MGRIKTKNIKRVAEELVSEFPEEFNEDFEHNKKKVEELTTVQTNSLRNKIAGYIVALKRRVID